MEQKIPDRALHWAAKEGHTEILTDLIAKGEDPDARRVEDCTTPLHWAAQKGQTETALALINQGADLNARADDGSTPLHWAAQQGQAKTALALINSGANLNARADDGSTPLHWATWDEHIEIVKVLIEWDAALNATADNGTTPLDWTYEGTYATQAAYSTTADTLIDGGGVPGKRSKFVDTPLHQAAEEGDAGTVTALITEGADPNPRNKYCANAFAHSGRRRPRRNGHGTCQRGCRSQCTRLTSRDTPTPSGVARRHRSGRGSYR